MFFALDFFSVASISITPMIGDILLFGVLFAVSVILFAAALMRQTIGTALFSCFLWFALAFAVWFVGESTSALTQGCSYIFLGLGFVMLIVSFYFVFEQLRKAAEEKQRQVAEDVL